MQNVVGRELRLGGYDFTVGGGDMRTEEGWHEGDVQTCKQDCEVGKADKDVGRGLRKELSQVRELRFVMWPVVQASTMY